MIVNANCVFLGSNERSYNGKTYVNARFDDGEQEFVVSVDESVVSQVSALPLYREYLVELNLRMYNGSLRSRLTNIIAV